jgi:hypothetical protein
MSLLQLEAEVLHRLEFGFLYNGLNMQNVNWQRQKKVNALVLGLYESDNTIKEMFESLKFLREGHYYYFKDTNIRAAFRYANYCRNVNAYYD